MLVKTAESEEAYGPNSPTPSPNSPTPLVGFVSAWRTGRAQAAFACGTCMTGRDAAVISD